MKVAALASHSALDVFDGAKDEGFQTIALCNSSMFMFTTSSVPVEHSLLGVQV